MANATPAERMRKFRQELKSRPEEFKKYLQKERERDKRRRELRKEKKIRCYQLSNEMRCKEAQRKRNYRARIKHLAQAMDDELSPPSPSLGSYNCAQTLGKAMNASSALRKHMLREREVKRYDESFLAEKQNTAIQVAKFCEGARKSLSSNQSQPSHKKKYVPTRYERERAAMKNKPRKVLNLEERVLAIRLYQENPVYQRVASVFKCSWEQIRNVIANRDDILRYYGECQTVNATDSPQYVRNKKINFLGNVTYEFIKRAYYHRIAMLNDEVIRQRALKIRDILKIEQFHPNKAWIADFKKVYNIDWQNLDALIIYGAPPRSLDNHDLIQYCTRMVTKAVSLIDKMPKPVSKKDIRNGELEDDEDNEDNEASSAGGGSYEDNESDSLLLDKFEDVPVVNEVDDFAGMYLDTADIDEDEINEDEEGPTINYADYDGTDEMPDFQVKGNASASASATTTTTTTNMPNNASLLAEVQIKQERRSRSRSKSPQLLSPLTVASGTSTNGTGGGDSKGVKRKRTDTTEPAARSAAATDFVQSVKREPVTTYMEAMHVLQPLEEFAVQKEDFHALNLLMQLTRVFEKGATRKFERRDNI
ncbi:PREDICTED: uncharacterized protein LOC108379712 [Rhagoletis zephyria]|uniref:uncharacterized protein LOC108379712 n=1 Tax=Rhagoletis zephyria TaxID=28612 RepID=UPI0008116309|nr:PREDICTED: uncharacterized protein LOC108379712 [Rhagoletis zephyria]